MTADAIRCNREQQAVDRRSSHPFFFPPYMHRATKCVAALALCAAQALSAQTAPAEQAAQTVPPAVFAYLVAGDTTAFEVVRGDPDVLRGVFIVPKQVRVHWEQQIVQGVPGSLMLGYFPFDAPAEARPNREIDYVRRADSVVVTARDPRSSQTVVRPSITGAVPVFSSSMIHLASVAYYTVQQRLRTVPLFLSTSGKTVDATIQVFGEEIWITADGLLLQTVWNDGGLVEMRVPSQELVVRRVMALPPAP
jgi:hypothetical protein